MKTTIWKYPIEIQDEQNISMPFCAVVIHAGLDPNGTPSVWAKVNPEETYMERVTISIRGTGHGWPENGVYVTSFNHGPFVWHVFQYP